LFLKKNFPGIVAGYIVAVGVFFCISALIEGALIDFELPGRYLIYAISTIFIAAGSYSLYLFTRGKLKKAGKSITEVLQQAVERMTDPAMLAQIALEEDAIISDTAKQRLNKLDN
jgi:hypothetical protein